MPAYEHVVHPVKECTGLGNVAFGRIVELGLEHVADGVAYGHHAADAGGGIRGDVGGIEAIAIADEKPAVALGERAFLDAGERFGFDCRARRGAAFIARHEDAFRQRADSTA